eukprot:TRINITY_DN988_c0_g1_i2.p1 TRINITY_DN988_c0_g1~~TRINITY_DN988_c0_g1_i2.p1  ORF type:complete len:548 (-),score=172.93 TRINITY_DN988_c0_g1_i2:45-1637(-)
MYCELGTQLKTMVQKIQSIANPAQKTKSALRLMMFMTTIVSRMPHLFEAGSQSLMIKLVEPFRFFSPEGFGELVSALAKSKRLYQPQTANLLGKDVGIESLIFAQQVTIREWEFFTSIRVEEFYNLSWSKPALQHLAPNLCATIKWSNLFCTWVSSYVLAEKNTQKRATHLGQLIGLADNLLGMNNFNGAMEVYSGITKIAVYRLKQTWEKLPTKSTETFSKLEKVFSPEKNFAAYRAMLQNATPPCMPFLGIHLSDLTFTDEGIKGTVPSKLPKPDGTVESLINFDKWKKVGKILLDITQGRSISYTHKADHLLLTLKEDPLAFLLALTSTKKSESSLEELGTDESQMAQSLKIEPKAASKSSSRAPTPQLSAMRSTASPSSPSSASSPVVTPISSSSSTSFSTPPTPITSAANSSSPSLSSNRARFSCHALPPLVSALSIPTSSTLPSVGSPSFSLSPPTSLSKPPTSADNTRARCPPPFENRNLGNPTANTVASLSGNAAPFSHVDAPRPASEHSTTSQVDEDSFYY